MVQPSSSTSSTQQITWLRSRRSSLDSLQLWTRSQFPIAQSTPTSAFVCCLAGPSSELLRTSSISSTGSQLIMSTLCLLRSKRTTVLQDFSIDLVRQSFCYLWIFSQLTRANGFALGPVLTCLPSPLFQTHLPFHAQCSLSLPPETQNTGSGTASNSMLFLNYSVYVMSVWSGRKP